MLLPRHLLFALVVTGALAAPTWARAQSRAPRGIASAVAPPPSPEVRARVNAYLESVDTPIRDEDWKALGPGAATVLEEIARDPARLPTRRARAVTALAVVGSASASKLVVDLAQRESEASLVRMSALRAAGQLLDAGAVVTALTPVLENAKTPRIRAAAAAVLVQRNPAAGCASVRKRLPRERPDSRLALERTLAPCPAAQR
jgi:hypothetical protein